jgi:hypothetical protein
MLIEYLDQCKFDKAPELDKELGDTAQRAMEF